MLNKWGGRSEGRSCADCTEFSLSCQPVGGVFSVFGFQFSGQRPLRIVGRKNRESGKDESAIQAWKADTASAGGVSHRKSLHPAKRPGGPKEIHPPFIAVSALRAFLSLLDITGAWWPRQRLCQPIRAWVADGTSHFTNVFPCENP